jgi:DNA polymerase (family 10)
MLPTGCDNWWAGSVHRVSAPQRTTADVVAMLEEMAVLTKLDEGSPQSFKVRAYENAVDGIEAAGVDVTTLDEAALVELKGVGRSIAEKIREFVDSGTVKKLEELREQYPSSYVELSRIPGLGPKTLALIRRELGVEDLDGLKEAIAEERLRELPGLGETSEKKIAKAIERLGLHGKDRRTPISTALPLALRLVEELSELPGVSQVMYCGSLRRHAETIGDVDITASSTDPAAVMDHVASHPLATEVIGHGDTKTSVLTREGLQVDVRVVEPAQFGAATLYFTGSKAHNIALRQRAIDRGMLLNEYGLFDEETGEVVARETEEEIYRALDLDFIPAPLREHTGEIEAAASGSLPDLVTLEDIRGDLHDHTVRSGDGRSTLEEMVEAALEQGYEYLAITDHGEDLTINGSTREEMLAHRERIRSLGDEHPEIRVLFGCELNIGPDGGLDYDDEFRAGFEFTVASVHSHFDLSRDEQTARLVTAISDPTVDVIGHLTGRYIGRRPGIEFDVDTVLDALADTGTGLEVNGALERLDAPAPIVRRAVARGVPLVISTDSHHTSELGRMQWGVRTAQRGWAPASAVVNTRPLPEFLEWLEGHRA